MTFDVTLHPCIYATPRSENVLIGEAKVSALRKVGVK